MSLSYDNMHASCIAINGRGVLLTGLSGAGKSDLALRLIDRGAVLISDDQTILNRKDQEVWASAPDGLKGRMEVRGIGICEFQTQEHAPVDLIVELSSEAERFPMDAAKLMVLGLEISVIKIDARQASAPIKLELALTNVQRSAS